MNKKPESTLPKLLSTLILLLSAFLVLGSCADGGGDDDCPNPSRISGQYALCLMPIDKYDEMRFIVCVTVDTDLSTPNGIYEADKEITATPKMPCTEYQFLGWYDDVSGELVSTEWAYTFKLVKDTYLRAEGRNRY